MKRYYLHGDLKEGSADLFYCKYCDLFGEIEHFRSEYPKCGDYQRFVRSRLIFEQSYKPYGWYRPKKAVNCLD